MGSTLDSLFDELGEREDVELLTQKKLLAERIERAMASVVRLHYDPVANTLNTKSWFTPFKDDEPDRDQDHLDQDLGSAGVLVIPGGSSTVLAGGKEGIFYNVNRGNMGKDSPGQLLQPAFVATFTPTPESDYLNHPNRATALPGLDGHLLPPRDRQG